jgi:hypothetical protein
MPPIFIMPWSAEKTMLFSASTADFGGAQLVPVGTAFPKG